MNDKIKDKILKNLPNNVRVGGKFLDVYTY